MAEFKLHGYWRSTAAYRVRIAMNLKDISYEHVTVDLVKEGGQQHGDEYVAKNPSHLVPTLELGDGTTLGQSMAIIDYIDALIPSMPLVPSHPLVKAKVLEFAHTIAMDIHPVNNLRVVQHLGAEFGADADAKAEWMRHWMAKGFTALEALCDPETDFAITNRVSVADICLVAQMYNARRWGLDLAPYPRLVEIEEKCLMMEAFDKARPENQPDAT